MPHRLFRYYQRSRLLNTNVNVIAAGLLAMAIVKGLIWLIHLRGPELPPLFYNVFALVADLVVDLAIFYGFHWVANHWRPLKGRTRREQKELEARSPNFFRDATIVQAERTLLSPLYYITAFTLMYWLQKSHGWDPGWAFVTSYATGLLLTRAIHTAWGLHTGRFKDNRRREIERRLRDRRADRAEAARRLREAEAALRRIEAEVADLEPAGHPGRERDG